MKIYKNRNFNIFSIIFAVFIFFVLLINIVNDIKYLEFENIKYYLLIIVPLLIFSFIWYKNIYMKIIIDKSIIYLNKLFYRKKIPLYDILKIDEPYIMTTDEIIFLHPKDINFWKELKECHCNYYKLNLQYFNETIDIYNNLISIMLELNKDKLIYIKKNRRTGNGFGAVVYFVCVLLKNMYNYITKYSLRENINNEKLRLRKYIADNIDKSNFA